MSKKFTSKTVRAHRSVNQALVLGVQKFISRRSTDWSGTMSDLSTKLAAVLKRDEVPEAFPKSPSALRVALNRVVRSLREKGVTVKFDRTTDRSRTRIVHLVTK